METCLFWLEGVAAVPEEFFRISPRKPGKQSCSGLHQEARSPRPSSLSSPALSRMALSLHPPRTHTIYERVFAITK